MKPILTVVCWASAGLATSASAATGMMVILPMASPLCLAHLPCVGIVLPISRSRPDGANRTFDRTPRVPIKSQIGLV